jgi:hypothetical protein
MVDAIIRNTDGREAGLEVVSHHDSDFNRQWDALEKRGHDYDFAGLEYRWAVQLKHRADVRRVLDHIHGLLATLEGETGSNRRTDWDHVPSSRLMRQLGINMAYTFEGPPGRVTLRSEGWSGWAGAGEIAEWVETFLASQPDVATKLDRHGGAEGHAFIWTTIGTDYSIQSVLENRSQGVPSTAPSLPSGITHVWIGGAMSSQRVLAWAPVAGWREVFRWADEQPLQMRYTS